MNRTVSVTFPVADVERATTVLPEESYKAAVESLLTIGLTERDRQRLEEFKRKGWQVPMPEPPPTRPIEACARYYGTLVADVPWHPVVAAVHLAFLDHRLLRLSPDVIWLMICQGAANHINANSENLRSRFVTHKGELRICVRRDDFVKGSPENPWPEVFDGFSAQIRKHVGPGIDLFLPAFSTTGPVEIAAAQIVLLDAMASYFEYALKTRCGIPEITLEGTTSDWELLARRAEEFAELGLQRWITVLRPILSHFVRASRGDADTPFWQSICKLNGQSGGPVITGWITAFFPYLRDRQTREATQPVEELLTGGKSVKWCLSTERRRLVPDWYSDSSSTRLRWSGFVEGATLEDIPGGLSKAPFRWAFPEREVPMEFLAGFVGVAQDHETLALSPEIGWAVREEPAPG